MYHFFQLKFVVERGNQGLKLSSSFDLNFAKYFSECSKDGDITSRPKYLRAYAMNGSVQFQVQFGQNIYKWYNYITNIN